MELYIVEETSVINELEKKLKSKEKELQQMKVKLKKSEESKFICIHSVIGSL